MIKRLTKSEIENILVEANELCLILKYLYYKCSQSAILDWQYDMLEHGMKHLIDHYEIDIESKVTRSAIHMVDCAYDEWPTIDKDVHATIEYARSKYTIVDRLLKAAVGQMQLEIMEEIKAISAKYGITEDDLKELDKEEDYENNIT